MTPVPTPIQAENELEKPVAADLELRVIQVENVQSIAPVAILDDSSFIGSDISPDGEFVAVRTFYGSLFVDEVSSGNQIANFYIGNTVLKSAFSHDHAYLAALHERPTSPESVVLRTDKTGAGNITTHYGVSLWQLSTGRLLYTNEMRDLCGDQPAVDLFQFLDDGSFVAASIDHASHTQTICQISTDTGDTLRRMDIDPALGYAQDLAMSGDGRWVAIAFSSDMLSFVNPRLVIMDFSTQSILFQTPVAVMPDLAFIDGADQMVYNDLSAQGEPELKVISPQGDVIHAIDIPPSSIQAPPISANKDFVAVAYQGDVKVFSLSSGEEVSAISPVGEDASAGIGESFSGYSEVELTSFDNRLLIYQNCMTDRCSDTVRVVDLNRPERDILRKKGSITFANDGDLSPNGEKIAVGGLWNGDIRVWSAKNAQLIWLLQGHTGIVYQTAFSPDSKLLASASADGTIRLWDVENGAHLRTMVGHTGPVFRMAFSPDGSRLISSGEDQQLIVWNVASGSVEAILSSPVPDGVVDRMIFTSDHTVLVSVPNLGDECNGCKSKTFIVDLLSGQNNEMPWEWLAAYHVDEQDWLMRYGSTSSFLSTGQMTGSDFVEEMTTELTPINDSAEIALSADGSLIFTLNSNGLNVLDRATGEQRYLAANYLGPQSAGTGHLEAAPDQKSLVAFTGASIVIWGIHQ